MQITPYLKFLADCFDFKTVARKKEQLLYRFYNQQTIFDGNFDFVINRKAGIFEPFSAQANKRNVAIVRLIQIGNGELASVRLCWRAIRFALGLFELKHKTWI